MKILFVCLGNICRSPAGENVLNHLIKETNNTKTETNTTNEAETASILDASELKGEAPKHSESDNSRALSKLDAELTSAKRTQFTVDSAGTANYHSGGRPDSRMIKTLESRGIEVTGRARQFKVQDFKDFDLILTMDHHNYEDVISMTRNKKLQAKVKPFTSLLTEHSDEFIPDPYTDGQAGFEYVVDLMFDGCSNLLEQIKKS